MQYVKWVLAVSMAALLAPSHLLAAEVSVEVGVAGVGISDDAKRVNEYSVIRPDQGAEVTGKVDLTGAENGVSVDVQADYMGSRDQKYGLELDVKRIL